MFSMPIMSFVVCVAIGSLAGWLETERLADRSKIWINCLVGITGSLLAAWFFFVWGELVPPKSVIFGSLLAPFASATVGAACSLTVLAAVLYCSKAFLALFGKG